MGTSTNDLRKVLTLVLGFEQENGKDHVYFVLTIQGITIARTKFSHSWRGNHQIDNAILALQAKQLHCSTKTLKALLQGRLGKQEYYQELLSNKHITQDQFEAMIIQED